jgi:pyruvate kinase
MRLPTDADRVPEIGGGQWAVMLTQAAGAIRDSTNARDDAANLGEMAAVAPRRTKILATIGPASGSPERLAELAAAGMDGARLNFSHGSHDQHRERAESARAAAAEAGRPLALVADLQGPKLRLGDLPEPRTLTRGEEVVIAAEGTDGNGELPISPAVIGEVLAPGNDVLIDDGLVHLKVEEVEGGKARCAVVVGGAVSAHKGVNLPGVPLPIPSLTPKDISDLQLALSLGVDYVALSFVRSAVDVRDLRTLIEQAGSHAEVIAKIEKAEAVDALEEILAETDAIMVARGDLGVEIGSASVPLLQKRIILRALEAGKPVITATQMLESMIEHAEPTRAEASDVANAVLDGSSALMLSGETAVGAYPVESVAYMDRIARAVEPSLPYRHELPDADDAPGVGRAMSNAACDLAEVLRATAILVPTATGRTASAVARLRPRRPIVGLTHNEFAVQQMALEWGVIPLLVRQANAVEDLWELSIDSAREAGLISSGDRVVLTAGTSVNIPGSTNVIKVDVA